MLGAARLPATAEPQAHGLAAATRMNRPGNTAWPPTLATATRPSSRGWRRASRASRRNSVTSSRNRTPRWALVISPERGTAPPPPIRPAAEMLWWGARKGGSTSSPLPGGSRPTQEAMAVTSSDSAGGSGGRMLGRARASRVLPAPGGPINRMWWAPAAAISRARRAVAWPRTSARSTAGSGAATGPFGAGGSAARPFPDSQWATSSWRSRTPWTGCDVPRRAQDGDRDGQVEAAALFWELGGRQVDGDLLARELHPAVVDGDLDPLPGLLQGAIGQPHDVEARQARPDVGFDVDPPAIEAEQGPAERPSQHRAPMLPLFWATIPSLEKEPYNGNAWEAGTRP